MQVDNPMSATGRHLNTVITVTPQNVFSHTNPTTQPGVNNEPLYSIGGLGGTVHPSSTVTDLLSIRLFTSTILVEKTHDLGKKS